MLVRFLSRYRLPAETVIHFDKQVERARDYDTLIALPAIEDNGSLLFCIGERLHGAPLNIDETASFQELFTVEEAEWEEERLAEIARKLGCKP